jgi:hypothetical protein
MAGDLLDDESCPDSCSSWRPHLGRRDEKETDLLCCPSTIQGHLALTGSHVSHHPFICTAFVSLACHLRGSVRELGVVHNLQALYQNFWNTIVSMGLSSFNLFRPYKKHLAGKQFAAVAFVKQTVTWLWELRVEFVGASHALTQVVHLTPA